jgi:AraC family transcriptional regulator
MLPHRDIEMVRRAAVTRAVEMMRGDPAAPHQLHQLARAGRYSPFHFHRIFREVTGLTPASYLAAVRMAHARWLLLHSDLAIAHVSGEVGYRSLGAFTSQFGRLAGISPQRFRNLMSAMRRVPVGALLSALDPHVDLNWQHDTLPRRPAGRQCVVTLSGRTADPALVLVGLLPPGGIGAGSHWRVFASTASPFSLPIPPRDGSYSAFVVAVPAYACLVDTFIDHSPGAYLIGTSEARFPADGESLQVEVRQPQRTDPPVLGTAPVRWLAYRAAELVTAAPVAAAATAAPIRPGTVVVTPRTVDVAAGSPIAGYSGGPGSTWRQRT